MEQKKVEKWTWQTGRKNSSNMSPEKSRLEWENGLGISFQKGPFGCESIHIDTRDKDLEEYPDAKTPYLVITQKSIIANFKPNFDLY